MEILLIRKVNFMNHSIAHTLFERYSASLNLTYEVGGFVEVFSDGEIYTPAITSLSDEPGVYIWNESYPIIWHTHPTRDYKYEPPSGQDFVGAMSMSIERGGPVESYVVTKGGVWYYRVYADPIKSYRSDLYDDLYFLGNNFASRLNGNARDLLNYDDGWDTPLSSIDEYMTKWTLNADFLQNVVEAVEFVPMEHELARARAI
jgi:hypothetical protein